MVEATRIATSRSSVNNEGCRLQMDSQALADLETRVAVLERLNLQLARSNRRMKFFSGAAFIAVVAALLIARANAASVENTIRAQSFIVYDAAGHIRATLGMAPDGQSVGLSMNDANGNLRLEADVAPNGAPGFDLYDEAGHERAALAVGPRGIPGLGLYDEAGKLKTSLDIPAHNTPGLGFYDNNGKGWFGLP
jgi:hypothetical protein